MVRNEYVIEVSVIINWMDRQEWVRDKSLRVSVPQFYENYL